jgi:hypothetical protein
MKLRFTWELLWRWKDRYCSLWFLTSHELEVDSRWLLDCCVHYNFIWNTELYAFVSCQWFTIFCCIIIRVNIILYVASIYSLTLNISTVQIIRYERIAIPRGLVVHLQKLKVCGLFSAGEYLGSPKFRCWLVFLITGRNTPEK